MLLSFEGTFTNIISLKDMMAVSVASGVGAGDGSLEGSSVGLMLGYALMVGWGEIVGLDDGNTEIDGSAEGLKEGASDGFDEMVGVKEGE